MSEYRYPELPTPAPLLLAEPERVGAYDAKTHLTRLLDQVEQGQSFIITRHGQPVARLVPTTTRSDAEQVIAALFSFRGGRRLGAVSVRQLVEEGRR